MSIWIVLWIILCFFSYWDLKEKRLPLGWLLIGIFGSVVYALLQAIRNGISIREILVGMVPGMILIILALAAKGSVGCGDGLVLIIIGNLMGAKECLLIFLSAVLVSFGYSCMLLVFCRKKKGYSFPFVPFYLLGAVIVGVTVV